MNITVKFHIGSLTGKPQLYPGTDTLEHSVLEALDMAIMNGDKEAMEWLIDNIREIESIE